MGPGPRGVARPDRGALVLVPFPFTDLTGQKQRPAIVISPPGVHPQDLVVCAVTSRVPPRVGRWEIPLEAADIVERRLPRPSVILVGKLFTIHRNLVRGVVGRVESPKMDEVLDRLRELFTPR